MSEIEHIVKQPTQRRHKTPLLFQHGAWHGAWCWQEWLDYFARRGYEVHAHSLPGHGASPLKKHINLYSLADYVDTLSQIVAQIDPKPVVIGHSMGGAILQKYMEKRPLPAAVLLASIPAGGILPMMLRLLRRHPGPTLKGLLTLNNYHFVATPELAKDLFFSAKNETDVTVLHAQLVRESMLISTQVMRPFARSTPFTTPILALAGEKDFLFSVAEEKETAAKYKAQFHSFPEQAHNLMLEPAWQQVADTIDHWLVQDVKIP